MKGRSVLVTGHTGFKGSWLTLWLDRLGARVAGYALDPPTSPSHFEASGVADVLARRHPGRHPRPRSAREGLAAVRSRCRLPPGGTTNRPGEPPLPTRDVRRERHGNGHTARCRPGICGGPVRSSSSPVTSATATKVRSGASARTTPSAVTIPTAPARPAPSSWSIPIGPHSSRRREIADHGVRLASVRAGNVIGGGDWAADRIVPDAVRALSAGEDLIVRNPASTRPWQHVLEPLSGYLTLAARLLSDTSVTEWSGAWNFGPLATEEASVAELATQAGLGVGFWALAAGWDDADRTSRQRHSASPSTSLSPDSAGRPRGDSIRPCRGRSNGIGPTTEAPSGSMQTHSLDDIAAYEGTAN